MTTPPDNPKIPQDILDQLAPAAPLQEWERLAIERLIDVAKGNTGQSRLVANFLLSWWNADECGRFDPRDMWPLDGPIVADVVSVFAFVGRRQMYPDNLEMADRTISYEAEFKLLFQKWRSQQ